MTTITISLTQGFCALVDEGDFFALSQFKWHTQKKSSGLMYAARKSSLKDGPRRHIPMQNSIMNPPPGLIVDHINGNGLDNRRSNLRICSHLNNCRNKKSSGRERTSRFRGVGWSSSKQRWRAAIQYDGFQHHLGYFRSEFAAALAYNAASLIHHGEFGTLNTIPEWP